MSDLKQLELFEKPELTELAVPLRAMLIKLLDSLQQPSATELVQMVENANSYRIRVDMKTLSSTNGGFATVARESGDLKMRVAIHDGLDEPSRFGVLCHELAHILLGHLGSDFDHWWPARTNLSHSAFEVEAESVAWVVTSRFGLAGSSAAYVCRHLKDGQTPTGGVTRHDRQDGWPD